MHWEKGAVKEDKREGEVNLAPSLIHHAPKHFGEPEVNRAEHSEKTPAKQHIMNVRHDEVGVVNEKINRSGSHIYPAQTSDNKHRYEGESETHCCGVPNGTAPDCAHPVKRFDGR